MKIAQIDVFQVDLPYSGGVYRLSGGREYRSFDATIVRITTDTGIEGWGESTPFGSTYIGAHARGVRAGIDEIAPSLLGLDPRRTDRINDAMDCALVAHEHAKTALDVACWDIFGKSVHLPVCELLGGRTSVKMPVISSIYAGDPEDMRKRVANIAGPDIPAIRSRSATTRHSTRRASMLPWPTAGLASTSSSTPMAE